MRKREATVIFNDLADCHEEGEDGFSHLPVFHHMTFTELSAYAKPEPLLMPKFGKFL